MRKITEAMVASRRGFMLGSGAILIAKPKLLIGPLPQLWGDGEHDDTEALNALFQGRPIRTAGTGDTFLPLFKDGWAALKGGRYWIDGVITPTVPFAWTDSVIRQARFDQRTFDFSRMPATKGIYSAIFANDTFELAPDMSWMDRHADLSMQWNATA